MILWFILAGMAAMVLLLLLYPVLRAAGIGPASRAEHDIEVFLAQLSELDRDRDRGLLPEQEANTARREVERRLLAAGDRASQAVAMATLSRPGRMVLAVLLILVLPAAATGIYLTLGTPGLSGQPFASRLVPGTQSAENDPRLAAVEAFEQLTRDDPAEAENWLNLGSVQFSLGRYEAAAAAIEQAVDLTDRHPGALSAYGEALLFAADGAMSQDALAAFKEALAADPGEIRARFYMALADYQSGRRMEALNQWLALAKGAPADAPWLPAVQDRIRAVSNEMGMDTDALLAEAAPAPAQPLADDQLAQIRGMVDGLAARLEQQPDDLEGWLMLGRSYMVLGQTSRAVTVLTKAAELAPDRPQISAALLVATVTAAEDDPAMAADIPALTDRVLSLDPDNVDALWYAGLASERAGDRDSAETYWQRLLAQLPSDSEEYAIVEGRIDAMASTP